MLLLTNTAYAIDCAYFVLEVGKAENKRVKSVLQGRRGEVGLIAFAGVPCPLHLLRSAYCFLFWRGDNVLYLLFTGLVKRHLLKVALGSGVVV
ncbi:hypothetical protein [Sphingobacterium sp. SGR-19]|uniref:hypothetical protein n=1 Tax=Sphingobacterium sp. SGR-19 TaxID=2710886 RepID=UPI0013ED952D|nr:hypothetical protein [Sphingobacterium sp. SGR-19]NGM65425.1 hypothetical protein [Sphingobacterium sp. SGR-19]